MAQAALHRKAETLRGNRLLQGTGSLFLVITASTGSLSREQGTEVGYEGSGDQESSSFKDFKNEGFGERRMPGCLHTCNYVHLVLRGFGRPPLKRVCSHEGQEHTAIAPPPAPAFFPKSQDKRDCLHLISSMAFRRHVKWLSEWAGGHTRPFI